LLPEKGTPGRVGLLQSLLLGLGGRNTRRSSADERRDCQSSSTHPLGRSLLAPPGRPLLLRLAGDALLELVAETLLLVLGRLLLVMLLLRHAARGVGTRVPGRVTLAASGRRRRRRREVGRGVTVALGIRD